MNEQQNIWVWGDELDTPDNIPEDIDKDDGQTYSSVEELIEKHPEILVSDD